MMKSELWKWKNGSWEEDPTDNIADAGEIIFAKGDEEIEASAGEDACRIILFYDKTKKKAALLHTNDKNGNEYKNLISAINIKKFSTSNTKVFIVGDEGEEDYKEWNDDIENYINSLGYTTCRITKGVEKEVKINPGEDDLKITDGTGFNLLKTQ